MKPTKREMRSFNGLRKIVATLRGPDGCAWDRVQTHRSLRPYLLEEASETLEALEDGNPSHMAEELGDLLVQVVIHVQIGEEEDEFAMEDVIGSITDKLVRRHPHVFGNATAATPAAVEKQWDELKQEERRGQSALAGIARTLPALARAQAIQRRASSAGFKWDNEQQAWDKLEEELAELREARTPEARREEVGDALFALVGLAGWLNVDAEDALHSTSRGFMERFERMESALAEEGGNLKEMTTDGKLALWEQAKQRQ